MNTVPVVRDLGGRIVQVEISSLQANVFHGTVVVWDGQRLHRVDSRSSDAVAIAVGHHVPIYVAEPVLATRIVLRHPALLRLDEGAGAASSGSRSR